MKNLLLTLLLTSLFINVNAQNDAEIDKDISIELKGGQSWRETDFLINIEKKGNALSIKYRLRGEPDIKAINNDNTITALRDKYKNMAEGSVEKKSLGDKLLKMMHEHRPTYKDSTTLTLDPVMSYGMLLNYIAQSKEEAFNGGNEMMDGNFLFCNISYGAENKKISKSWPLSVSSPLLYAFLNETLKVGQEKKLVAPAKISEVFKSLF